MTRRQGKETIEGLEERLEDALTHVKQAEEENWDLTKENARLQTEVRKLRNSNNNEGSLRKRDEEATRKMTEENAQLMAEIAKFKDEKRFEPRHQHKYNVMEETRNMLQTALNLEKDTNSLAMSLVIGTGRMLAELCQKEAILVKSEDTLDEIFATLVLAMNALHNYTDNPERDEDGKESSDDQKTAGEKTGDASDQRMDVD